ncbi:cytochrome P450 [Xylariaceae sp. FL0662B]|nr:cytochrome P450 [Xylariaceae sp. FL0662B]
MTKLTDRLVEGFVRLHAWPTALFILLLILLTLLGPVAGYFSVRTLPSLPKGSPQHRVAGHLPLIGAAFPFFRRRRDMLVSNESFSFFVGSKHIVNLSGLDGRKTFFESRNLSVSQGAIELLAGLVSANDDREDYGAQDFIKSLLTLLRPSMLVGKLPRLTRDIRAFNDSLNRAAPLQTCPQWRVLNPFETIYSLMFKLIMRVVGVSEWLENEKLLNRNLSAFCKFEENCSRVRIVFPWLITLTHVKKLFYGAILYMSITKVVNQRKKTGKRQEDTIQFLLDNNKDVIRFLFSILSSGITTEGCSAAWLTVFLAHSPEWQARCRAEVDSVIAKMRESQNQSADNILGALSLQEWEAEFPVIVAAFRETVRLAMPGAMFRKNTSGSAVLIGDTGEVIPANAYASFHMDNVHMDPQRYSEPMRFNPGRYLFEDSSLDRQEQEPHTYVGWGSGRHLCPGMRLAKLEITMVMAHLLAGLQLEPSCEKGSKLTSAFPLVDRHGYRMTKPEVPIYVRYKARE